MALVKKGKLDIGVRRTASIVKVSGDPDAGLFLPRPNRHLVEAVAFLLTLAAVAIKWQVVKPIRAQFWLSITPGNI